MKSLEKIHKRIPKREKKIIYSQKEILISSLYVIKNIKYMYHMNDFLLLKKCTKNIFWMALHQMDIDGFKWDLFHLLLEPMVINFTCDYSMLCVLLC